MKTITFPVGYRPDYLKQFLNHLKSFDLSDYEIICSAENCPPCIEVLEMCGLPITVLRKPNSSGMKSHGGARDNMFNVLSYAFGIGGSTFNVHLEDDFALSPDVFDLADWYYDNFKDKPLDYMSYGLFNWGSAGDDYSGIIAASSFHGLGWCAFKENWDLCFGKYWYDDVLAAKYANAYGWDWAIQAAFKDFNYESLVPKVSRTFHAGRIDGTCCTVEFYDKTYPKLVWNKTEKAEELVLRVGVEDKHLYPQDRIK
jgi:hypothetical protein